MDFYWTTSASTFCVFRSTGWQGLSAIAGKHFALGGCISTSSANLQTYLTLYLLLHIEKSAEEVCWLSLKTTASERLYFGT